MQFVTMLLLVRLLTPEDYGSAALAQSIIGLISVASFGTFVLHALQSRDPNDIDWQAHFTAGVMINSALFCLTVVVAALLSVTHRYQSAAWPLAGLSTVFLVEIAATLRHRMLETQHDWRRFRVLVMTGTVLGAAAGVIVAVLGGGVWALVVQAPLFGLPAAMDLFTNRRWRPNWSWSWARYRETARFGFNRMGSATMMRGRQTVEQGFLAGTYDFGVLGVFTRAVGLATLLSGRLGSIAMMSLYPIVTRADRRSVRFQRIAGLVLRGVSWTTIPTAVFLALSASDVVAILYGPKWTAVIPLLPLAAACVALSGIASTLSSLLLANNELGRSFLIDLFSTATVVSLTLWLVPIGVTTYLAALAVHGFVVLFVALVALTRTQGISRCAILPAFWPPVVGAIAASLLVESLRLLQMDSVSVPLRMAFDGLVFAVGYLLIIRIVFPSPMKELLAVAPGGHQIAKSLRFSEAEV